MRLDAVWFVLVLAPCFSAPAEAADARLVVLAETGQERAGMPILRPHSNPAQVLQVLSRGFSGRLLQLYQYEQEYLRQATGSQPEPAYLLLSRRQGGFPRFGFYLDSEDKRQAGYVDLFGSSALRGRFGSMDQIFPHELAHIIVRQLAGESEPGGSNQVHAVGVRTDPRQAFQEGFAEHFQILAVEDPDADPATRALAYDPKLRERSARQGERFQREINARWAFAGPMRMGFLLWFSATEQAWRYFSVKENAFAHEVELPERLIGAKNLYWAYLLQNVVPGDLLAPSKPPGILLSTEGVVSSLFYRWAVNDTIRQRYRDAEFYLRFGASRDLISPTENAYLKLFHVLFTKKPADTLEVINGYKSVFPDEAPSIDAIVQEVLLGQPLRGAPQIWLANRAFWTGTSLFDQFRSLPRIHTFDLNAAGLVDLLGVPGMTRSLAELIRQNAPFATLDELRHAPGFPAAMMEPFREMSLEMDRLRSASAEDEVVLSLRTILMSYVWRALLVLLLASATAAFLYRRALPVRPLRAAVNGFAASLLVLVLAWMTTGTGALVAFLGPMIVFAVPGSLWHLAAHRNVAKAARVLLAWAGAAIPAICLGYPWF